MKKLFFSTIALLVIITIFNACTSTNLSETTEKIIFSFNYHTAVRELYEKDTWSMTRVLHTDFLIIKAEEWSDVDVTIIDDQNKILPLASNYDKYTNIIRVELTDEQCYNDIIASVTGWEQGIKKYKKILLKGTLSYDYYE